MQKKKSIFHPGFTMLELIFVIVILGVVASIGSQLLAKVYDSYLLQRAMHKSSAKTELVATQLANRLAYAIPNTIIARQSPTAFTAIENAPSKNYEILEWIAYDADSFGYTGTPGWSGFCDVKDSAKNSTNSFSTPGSSLGLTTSIITSLEGTILDAVILFPGLYNVHTVGFQGSLGASTISHVITAAASQITLAPGPGSRRFKEHYKLAWSAYAIVPTELTAAQYTARDLDSTDELYDLELHYNFQPWNGVFYDAGATKKEILIRNVSVFNFVGTGDTIRFKLCIQEHIGGVEPITMCKEKAVIR